MDAVLSSLDLALQTSKALLSVLDEYLVVADGFLRLSEGLLLFLEVCLHLGHPLLVELGLVLGGAIHLTFYFPPLLFQSDLFLFCLSHRALVLLKLFLQGFDLLIFYRQKFL